MHAHGDTMANQQGNGQNGYRNHHRDDDDHRSERDTDYRGMGQSGYGSGREADDSSMGTRNRNDYGRGRWEEGRMGYSQGYSYRDGDRPSFERGMRDYERNYERSYERWPRGNRDEDAYRPQPGAFMPAESHRGKGPKNFQMSDDRVRERVCEALHEDHDVDASDIEVSVSKGEVTLMGTVEDRPSKRMAEDCVLQCAGVRDVHNQLRVRR